MPLDLGPDVAVTRDADGVVRALNHIQDPYPGRRGVTVPELAAAYLRDAAEVFGIDAEIVEKADDLEPRDEKSRLVLAEEKSLLGSTTVGFAQHVGALQVWEAGASVTVQERPPQVVAAQSQYRREVKVDRIDGKALLQPEKPNLQVFAKLLGLEDAKQFGLRINGPGRRWLYRYDPEQRHHPEAAHASQKRRGRAAGPPTLHLPEIDGRIEPGVHYPVVEVLFRLSLPLWGPLNWRAFVEPVTGSVLYVRAFVACATGRVYRSDPTVSSGNLSLRANAATTADLDNQRSVVTLAGLVAPSAAGSQALRGEFVVIQDTNLPTVAPPTTTSPFSFDYSSPSDNFAAVATYYHADAAFRLVRDLGFTIGTYFNNTTFPVPVDHRGRSDVNANCEGNAGGNGVGRFRFGPCDTGTTVGMGSEGRTVYHEFGHALLWDSVNSPNFGFAHSAGDSLAMIVTDPHTALTGSSRFIVFTFCPLSPSSPDRRADRLPAAGWAWGGVQDTNGYPSEEILTTTLFRVYRSLGGDSPRQDMREFASRYASYLIIRAIGSLATSPVTPTPLPGNFADALMAADRLTTSFEGYSGGAMHKVIRWSFEKQGLYQRPGQPTPFIAPGAPPPVDVYIDDGRNGEYQFRENFWDTTDIWNRRAADGGTVHQEPVVGQPNFAYVRVKNRGTGPAAAIDVRGYHSRPMTGLIWPADWAPMTTALVTFPGPLASGGSTVVGPFEWTPTTLGHECLLMIASTAGDRSVVDAVGGTVTGGSIPHWRLVPFDNNIAQRNVAPVSGSSRMLPESLASRVFEIVNSSERRKAVFFVEVKLPPVLAKLGWHVRLKGVKAERFTLAPGQRVKVQLVAIPGEPFSAKLIREQHRPPRIDVTILRDGAVVGGMTFPVDPGWKR